jgi:hypothetical protein
MFESDSRSRDVKVDGLERSGMTGPGDEVSTPSELADDVRPWRLFFPGDEALSRFSASTPRAPADDDDFPSRKNRCMLRDLFVDSTMSARYVSMLEEYGSRTYNLFKGRKVDQYLSLKGNIDLSISDSTMELFRLIDKHDHEVNGSTPHGLLDVVVTYTEPLYSKQLTCERCLSLFFDSSGLLRPTTDGRTAGRTLGCVGLVIFRLAAP